MDEAPPAYHESRPTELNVSNRPTMPSPFDRATLHEQIKIKRACSPVDLVKLAGECDQLLNLPSIEQARNDVHDEEIDCGDLFGSESLFVSLNLTPLSLQPAQRSISRVRILSHPLQQPQVPLNPRPCATTTIKLEIST